MTKKKARTIDDSGITHEEQQSIGELADAIADKWQAPSEDLEDPFEEYVNKCLCRVCHDRHVFKGRFGRGYRALLAELSSKKLTE